MIDKIKRFACRLNGHDWKEHDEECGEYTCNRCGAEKSGPEIAELSKPPLR